MNIKFGLVHWDHSLYGGGLLFIVVGKWFFYLLFIIRDKWEKWANYPICVVNGMYDSRPWSRHCVSVNGLLATLLLSQLSNFLVRVSEGKKNFQLLGILLISIRLYIANLPRIAGIYIPIWHALEFWGSVL